MPTLETAIRLIVIGQQLLIAAVILAGVGSRAPRFSGVFLMLSFIGYVYMSDPALPDAIPLISPVTALLAIIVPYCLWLFARAVFEAPRPHPVIVLSCVLIVAGMWFIFLAGESVPELVQRTANPVSRVVALFIIGHAVWITLKGRPDDLVENRRTFRLFFVVVVSIQMAAVLVAELVLAGSAAPAWLDMTNVVIIEVMTLGLAIPMLQPNGEFFESEQASNTERIQQEASGLGAAERVYRQKLLDLMDEGYFRETGLTIPMLAGKLDYPEHQLRRLINGHLGFRNFTAFLNSYRLAEAKKLLSDPEKARTPVLTIALELGYASLGPFNRSFKAMTGMTPTDYRRQQLRKTGTDSE